MSQNQFSSSPKVLQKELMDFGKKMWLIGIFSLLSIFLSGVFEFLSFIVLLLSLGHIKRIYKMLDDYNLKRFRSNIINAVIVGIIGITIITVVTALLAVFVVVPVVGQGEVTEASEISFLFNFGMGIGILAVAVMILSTIFMMMAWSDLHAFFRNHEDMFSGTLGKDVRTGSKRLRRSYLLELIVMVVALGMLVLLLLVLSPMLVGLIESGEDLSEPQAIMLGITLGIPGAVLGVLSVIMFVLRLLGYFKLASLREIALES